MKEERELFPREKYLSNVRPFYKDTEMIKVITGVRRCGKSSLLLLIQKELFQSGVTESNIVSINLDKRPYKHIKDVEELEGVIDKCFAGVSGIKYLFIDEVQNVKGFEEVLNSYREERDYSIFITGSNSYLLSGELITKLTGRYLEIDMTTLTFDEYLGMKRFLGKNIDENIIKAIVAKNFDKDVSIAFVSKNNYIKKTKLKEFYTTRFSKPITCMRLNNGDELVDVSVVNGNSNFLITTKLGNSTYFNENQIEATGLRTLGVKAISTLKNSYICSLLSYRHDEKGKILFITDKGAARIFDISKLELTQRLGKTQKVFESFKSDLHSCVFATKILNTKEPLKLNALMSDNSITELIIDDFKITPEKNCKNNLNIDESKTIKQIFISEVQVIDDNTIVETPSNEDKHISNNSINNVYKKDENTEEEYEQISIFDEMGD